MDDFKLAGVEKDIAPAWKAISVAVNVEPPTEIGRYLGCNHIVGEMSMTDADDIIGRVLPGVTDTTKKWQNLPCKVKTMQYDMSDFMAQCVESYLTLAGKPAMCLSKVATPFLDESTAWCPPEGPPTGALAPIALKVLMKVLYAARVARPDLLRATCMMARRVTKWDADCDRRLHRLMCYITCTRDYVQTSYCGGVATLDKHVAGFPARVR